MNEIGEIVVIPVPTGETVVCGLSTYIIESTEQTTVLCLI